MRWETAPRVRARATSAAHRGQKPHRGAGASAGAGAGAMDHVEGHPVAVPASTGAESAPSMASPRSPAQAQAATIAANLVQPTLFSYIANDLVWARAGNKGNEPFWPVRPRLNLPALERSNRRFPEPPEAPPPPPSPAPRAHPPSASLPTTHAPSPPFSPAGPHDRRHGGARGRSPRVRSEQRLRAVLRTELEQDARP